MVTSGDIRNMVGRNQDITSLSKLKLVPPPEKDEPNPSTETRDDVLGRSSRSDRRCKRDGSSAHSPKTPSRYRRQGKYSSTSSDAKQGVGENSKTRPSASTRRERSESLPFFPSENPDGGESGAFDYSPIVGGRNHSFGDESSEVSNIPSSASALSKLLGTTSSATTAPINNMTTSPKKMKGTSPKKMTSNETDTSAKSTKPKVTIVGMARVYSRSLIPPKVYHSSATGLWISTINTSSNSSDDVKAFSFRTEQEARASAYANAPPLMIPFDSCSECMLCDNKFTLLRRRKSCRNCGICVCSNFSCSTNWRAKMIPELYNIKKTSSVKVCTSCDTLAKRFQHSLLEGRYETALELYLTGNINLRVPFAFKSEKEDMLPVHCAIKGKSEKLLRWLVETQYCPLQMFATSNKGNKSSKGKETEDYLPSLKTSKGKSIVDLAVESQDCGILRFLVKEKELSIFEVKDLDIVLKAMDKLLKEESPGHDESIKSRSNRSRGGTTKSSSSSSSKDETTKEKARAALDKKEVKVAYHNPPLDAFANDKSFMFSTCHESDEEGAACCLDYDEEQSVCTTRPDICIICNEKNIDCVAAPCGHQTCCSKCSSQLRYCPVCSSGCNFISLYQP